MRRLLQLSLIALSCSFVACGVLLGIGNDDEDPSNTTPPSNGDCGVLQPTRVDAFADCNGGGETDGGSSLGQDAGCPSCASDHCPNGPAQCDPLVFVTAEDYAGDFSEIADASGPAKLDVACNRSAAAAGIKGNYKAWVSADIEGENPSNRLAHTARPYRRRDGAIVVASFDGFTKDGGLLNRISLTAGGVSVLEARVWTGTRHDLSTEARDCIGWTNGVGMGEEGVTGITTCPPAPAICAWDHWTFRSADNCSLRSRVYCIEQVP